MGIRWRALAALVCAAALTAIAPGAAQARTWIGKWECVDRGAVTGIPNARVELWARGFQGLPPAVTGHVVDTGVTRLNGAFTLNDRGENDNYFVRIVLRDAGGNHLRDWYSPWDWFDDSPLLNSDQPRRNFGGIGLRTPVAGGSPKCATYRGLHFATQEFIRDVGSSAPHSPLQVSADAITGGVPFTRYDTVQWPHDFILDGTPGEFGVMRHEFGHTIRHSLDGGVGHWLVDVAAFFYPRNHRACDV